MLCLVSYVIELIFVYIVKVIMLVFLNNNFFCGKWVFFLCKSFLMCGNINMVVMKILLCYCKKIMNVVEVNRWICYLFMIEYIVM